jgi:hypothetical protein
MSGEPLKPTRDSPIGAHEVSRPWEVLKSRPVCGISS